MVCLIFTGAQSSQQLIVKPGTPAASEYIFTFRRIEKKEKKNPAPRGNIAPPHEYAGN